MDGDKNNMTLRESALFLAPFIACNVIGLSVASLFIEGSKVEDTADVLIYVGAVLVSGVAGTVAGLFLAGKYGK